MDAVVVAAGYGTIQPGKSKLVEEIDGAGGPTVITQLMRALVPCLEIERVVLVTNPRYGGSILITALQALGDRLEMSSLVQTDRRGAGDAVRVALPLVRSESFLVVFGDMPFWRAETLHRLIDVHEQNGLFLSMATVRLVPDLPPTFEKWGRVLRDGCGRIRGVSPDGDKGSGSREVNPSLYIFEKEFFCRRISDVPLFRRTDGHPDEISLPPLVAMAYEEEKEGIGNLVVDDPTEAMGINTVEDLRLARNFFALRRG
ncbi:MAG TPA: NTP transferase domain-containing protein [Patescibacteria group bacterium]|nr:NTP transferase domain-containing protein [Patescibacteria group bacterium]